MAAVANAFNSAILSGGSLLPTVFELLAQEALTEALRTASEYTLKTIANSHPELFGWAWRFKGELVLCGLLVVEGYFVTRHNGSFAEQFYGLQRIPHASPTAEMRMWHKLTSIACLVLLPYLRVKLEERYNHAEEEPEGRSGLFQMLYPGGHFLWEACRLCFRVCHLVGVSKYYLPSLWLAGVTLQRRTDMTESWRYSVSGIMLAVAYTLKFLEWWGSEGRGEDMRKAAMSLPSPPPPGRVQVHEGVNISDDPSLCPLCHTPHRIPTALASSGYVFCYSCIVPHVRRHKQCPVTHLPTQEQQIVRLYTTN